MKKLAVIYHSAHGNARRIAELVAEGARTNAAIQTELLRAEDLVSAPERLLAFEGFVFGSPTYLGGVSAPFKSFMDATGRLWSRVRLATPGHEAPAMQATAGATRPVRG